MASTPAVPFFDQARNDFLAAALNKICIVAAKKVFIHDSLDYAKDYENQIMEGTKTGTSVAFIQDANAFREKLLLSSAEISNQIKGLSVNSEQALKVAMQAKLRSQGLGKLVAKAHLEARKKLARAELAQLEDGYMARFNRNSGTENA